METKFDDENGKYYPIEEGITLALSDVFKEDKAWYLFFYGTHKFKLSEFVEIPTPINLNSVNNSIKVAKDDTTAKGKLPQTGDTIFLGAVIILLLAVAIVSYKNYKKNNY